jgi:multiple sugar transport system ATP-binding protein
MGRALVRRPKIFLLDEPLSNLDAQLRLGVRLELKRLHQQIQTTILYVTHDQVEAMTLGDQVVVMRQGRIHQIGPPDRIYNRPADTFVATFVGSPVMNLFKGKIVRSERGFLFQHGDFSLPTGHLPSHTEGCEVEVGIRPEDIEFSPPDGLTLQAKIEMLSNVGAEQYIHARLGKAPVTLRTPKGGSWRVGEMIPIHIDSRHLHIFYKGRRIEEDDLDALFKEKPVGPA